MKRDAVDLSVPHRRAGDGADTAPVKRSPEYVQAYLARMRLALISEDHKRMHQRYATEPTRITAMGGL